ncbi:hypothetical protein PLESTM_000440600 [Pleodorina starrii]|nr:hypothetical protein PLESTM_000440600 [Pleodorina starrii]
MRGLIVGPLRHRTCAGTNCASLWSSWTHEPRHQRPSTASLSCTSAQHAPARATTRLPSSHKNCGRSQATAAASPRHTTAGPTSHMMSGGADGTAGFHVLAFCRTADDASRVHEVAEEVAAAGASGSAPGGLTLHLDLAAVPPDAVPALDAAGCSRRLALPAAEGGTRVMGRVLLAAATLGSTQELLRTHGSALGDGVVAVADRQTSGKGRGGNQWTSPLGCLMFSALRRLRVASPSQAPFINYLVCLAITRGVRAALKESGLPPLDLRIKWPNDIYVGGVKVAGALIHTTWQGGCFNVITGIGLNVNNRTPTTCLDELIEKAAAAQQQDRAAADGDGEAALEGAGAASISREAVLTGILAALEQVYDTFEQGGFTPLEPEYLATWLHSGQVLDFDDSDPSSAGAGGGRVTRLTIRGLSPAGFLLAEDADGSRYELTPDGNSLDMMKGLIRRKVQ